MCAARQCINIITIASPPQSFKLKEMRFLTFHPRWMIEEADFTSVYIRSETFSGIVWRHSSRHVSTTIICFLILAVSISSDCVDHWSRSIITFTIIIWSEICHSNAIVPRKQSQTKDLHSNQFHSASFKDAKNYSLINTTQTSVLYQIIKVVPAQVCYDNGHIYLTVGCDSLIAVVCWTSQAQLCVCVVFTHLLCSRLTLLSKQLFDWKKFDLLLFSPLQRHFSPVW